jgi:4-diphosphocytidyl-2-C-methyl-D-erythritol kinase
MKLRAHAKVNLGLQVQRLRADGYHDIETVMVSVDLSDLVEVIPGSHAQEVSVVGPEARGVPADASNLALRAAGEDRVHLVIDKHIPFGAGLGGASADAAAVLHALGRGSDHGAAIALGADVAFCASGGAARVTGIGEVREAVSVPEELWIVLVVPVTRLSTSSVYSEWDRLGSSTAREVEVPGMGLVRNDLTGPAIRLAPELGATADALERVTGRPWLMTGSGSGLVLPLADVEEAARTAAQVNGRLLRPVPRGVEVL